MAMSRGHLAAGKQRLKEKLKTIDELKTRVFQYVTNLTEEPTEAALHLLQETDRGRFFGKFSSVSQDLEKCLDTLFLLCVSLNNDEDGCDSPVSELSSSKSSESSNGAIKLPSLPCKTEVSPDAVSKDAGRKKRKTGLKEMSHENESGFSSIQIDSESDTLQEETCKKREPVTSSSPLHQSGRSFCMQTNDTMSEEEIDKENDRPILSSLSNQSFCAPIGVDILREERTRNKSSSTLSSPTQQAFSSQPQSDADSLKERRMEEDICPTIASPHGQGDQFLTNQEEKIKQEEPLDIQSSPDQPGSCSMPTDHTVVEQWGLEMELEQKGKESDMKDKASSGDCTNIENEGQKRLKDVQTCHMLDKDVEAPEQRQDDSRVWGNSGEDGRFVPGEPSAILPGSKEDTDYDSFAMQQQEHHHQVLCTAPGVGMETHPPVMRKLRFNGEEIPLPSDTESELSSCSTSQPYMNVSCSSEDSAKDTELSSPHKETPQSILKPSIEVEGNDGFDSQSQVCTNRRTEEEEASEDHGQLTAQTLDHLPVQKDLDKVLVTEEARDGDGKTAEIVCATSSANEVVGTVSVASSTEDLEEVMAIQHCLKSAVLTPAHQTCQAEEKSRQSELQDEESSLSPVHVQQSSLSSVPADPLCHSSPVHTNNSPLQALPSVDTETFSPGYENHAEVKPHDTDPNREKENMPMPLMPPSNSEGNYIKAKSSSDNTVSEQDYCVSTNHTRGSVPNPLLCQSSPVQTPHVQQPLTVGAERLLPADYSESYLLQRDKEEEQNTSTPPVNTSDTPTVGSVTSCQPGYPVRRNPPVQPLSAAPVLSSSQSSSGQASMHHYHCPQVQGLQVQIPQAQGPLVQIPQVQGPQVPSLTFSDGDSLDVVVSDIINPSHFWIQPAGNQLNLLTEQLSLFYEKSPLPPGLPYTPAVGMFCAACFTQDNTWYRGRITAVHNVEGTGIAELHSPSSSMSPGPVMFKAPQIDVDILYVDYGNRERLSMSRVKELHQQFTHLPCQALCCGLAKVVPVNGSGSWTSQQAVWFARQVLGKKLQAVIDLDPSRHSTEVELFYTIPKVQDPEGQGSAGRVSISELMVSEKMAVERRPLHCLVEGVSNEVVQGGKFIDQAPRSPTVARPPQQRILNHDKMLQDQAQVQRLLQQQQEELQLRRQRSCRSMSTGSVADNEKSVPQKKDVDNADRRGTQNPAKPPTDKSVPSEEKPKKNEKSCSKAPTGIHDMKAKVLKESGMKGGIAASANGSTPQNLQKDWRLETADSSIDEYLDSLAVVPQQARDRQRVTSSDKEHSSEVERPDYSARKKGSVKANSSQCGSQTNRCESNTLKSEDIISPQWKQQIEKLSGNGTGRKPRKRGGAGKGRGRKIFSSSGSTTSEDDDRNWWRNDQKQKSLHEKKMGDNEQKEGKKDQDTESCFEDADVVEEGDSIQMKKPVVKLHEDGSFLLMTSYIVDPSEFYIHPVTPDAAKIDHLMKELNKFYQEKVDMLRHVTFEPCVNDICCARFSKDKTWYRAQICTVTYKRDCISLESVSGKKKQQKSEAEGLDCCEVQVFYLDYGNFEKLPVSEVLPLMPEFTDVPAHAVKCSLYGIRPITEPGEEKGPNPAWNRKAAKTFADLTPFDKALVGYVKHPKPVSEVTEVQPVLQLVLVDTTGSVDVCINDELVSSGVAEMCLPDAPPPTKPSTTKGDTSLTDDLNGLDEWDPRAADYLSERNSYFVDVDNAEVATMGYKSREIPVCKFFRPGSQCWKGDNCSYQHLQDGETKVTEKRAVVCFNHMVDLPPVHTLVAVEVTSVFNPGHFFVQFTYGGVPHDELLEMAADGVDVDKPNPLDELSKEINDHYSKKVYGEREVGIDLALGEIVIAKYSQDNQFYRARITSVNTETQEVWVFYVDYGNKERVQETDIHPIEARFCQLPFQAVECYLANIEPLPTDQGKPRWSKTARDVFFDLTGGKVLIAHVLSRGWNDTLYVALFDTTTETDTRIDFALVKAGFARRVNIYNEQSVQERMTGHREGLAPG